MTTQPTCAAIQSVPGFAAVTEKYPHISARLALYWGEPEFNGYLHGLLHDTRDGVRKGFDFNTVVTLQDVADEHIAQYPKFAPPEPVGWAHACL